MFRVVGISIANFSGVKMGRRTMIHKHSILRFRPIRLELLEPRQLLVGDNVLSIVDPNSNEMQILEIDRIDAIAYEDGQYFITSVYPRDPSANVIILIPLDSKVEEKQELPFNPVSPKLIDSTFNFLTIDINNQNSMISPATQSQPSSGSFGET